MQKDTELMVMHKSVKTNIANLGNSLSRNNDIVYVGKV